MTIMLMFEICIKGILHKMFGVSVTFWCQKSWIYGFKLLREIARSVWRKKPQWIYGFKLLQEIARRALRKKALFILLSSSSLLTLWSASSSSLPSLLDKPARLSCWCCLSMSTKITTNTETAMLSNHCHYRRYAVNIVSDSFHCCCHQHHQNHLHSHHQHHHHVIYGGNPPIELRIRRQYWDLVDSNIYFERH